MLEQALIDGLKFARERQHLRGELEVATLPRLEDLLFERTGTLGFSLTGTMGKHGKPMLEVEVQGRIVLVCQRCLERLDFDLSRKSRLILIADGQALPDLEDEDPDIEAVPAAAVTDVADLIEQEVLLAIPLAPLHPAGACAARVETTSTVKDSPFAALAALKTS